MARKKANPLQKVADRFGVTAREARDIATAVANLASVGYSRAGNAPLKVPTKRLVKDIKKQVKETARAAKTGKKGTTALRTFDMPEKGEYQRMLSGEIKSKQFNIPKGIKKGKKRK